MPAGSLQFSLNHSNSWAPLTMASVALPLYSTPTTVMMQLGSMFQHGNSVGAAFVLLTIGAGAQPGNRGVGLENVRRTRNRSLVGLTLRNRARRRFHD